MLYVPSLFIFEFQSFMRGFGVTKGHSISVIAALSVRHGLLLTHIFKGSNNAETFQKFIHNLREKCRGTTTYVVMDYLSVHHSYLIVRHFTFQFVAKFLPTYS